MIHCFTFHFIALHGKAEQSRAAQRRATQRSAPHRKAHYTTHYTLELFTNYMRFIALGAISVITFHCLPRSMALALGLAEVCSCKFVYNRGEGNVKGGWGMCVCVPFNCVSKCSRDETWQSAIQQRYAKRVRQSDRESERERASHVHNCILVTYDCTNLNSIMFYLYLLPGTFSSEFLRVQKKLHTFRVELNYAPSVF